MKLLFDQNLSPDLIRLLRSEYPGSEHVINLGMDRFENADIWFYMDRFKDEDIWFYAAQNGFMVVTKDFDFDQRALLLGHPPKVVRVTLGNCSTKRIADLLRSRRNDLKQFNADSSKSLLLVS